MTKDIGIVLLPNTECKDFARHMTEEAKKALPGYKEAPNNPHITMIHIANLDAKGEKKVKEAFTDFYKKYSARVDLPIKDIKATGGSPEEGYKWLDLQFDTVPHLAKMRQAAVDTFCPFHKGNLERMNDDMAKFTPEQKQQIEKCGVTYSNYLPHITAWYVDLPEESKTVKLEEVAKTLKTEIGNTKCYAESVALVELGRNGNAINIIEQQPLHVDSIALLVYLLYAMLVS